MGHHITQKHISARVARRQSINVAERNFAAFTVIAHSAGTSYRGHLGTFTISSDQFLKHLKTSLFVSEDTNPGR